MFDFGLRRGKDKMIYIRVIVISFNSEGYIIIFEEVDLGCLICNDVKIVKDINFEDCKFG